MRIVITNAQGYLMLYLSRAQDVFFFSLFGLDRYQSPEQKKKRRRKAQAASGITLRQVMLCSVLPYRTKSRCSRCVKHAPNKPRGISCLEMVILQPKHRNCCQDTVGIAEFL